MTQKYIFLEFFDFFLKEYLHHHHPPDVEKLLVCGFNNLSFDKKENGSILEK